MNNILIVNANYGGNKGAEAMITTLLYQIAPKIENAIFYIDLLPQFESYFKYIQNKLEKDGITIKPFILLPKQFLKNRLLGIKDENGNKIKISSIIDISGLSFNDKNIKAALRVFLKDVSLPYKVKRVRFTQDFGPINSYLVKLMAKLTLQKCQKIFPRSSFSKEVVRSLVSNELITTVYPDSAIILPVKESKFILKKNSTVIVPNEHSYNKFKERYITILLESIAKLQQNGQTIYLLQHSFVGNGDRIIITKLLERAQNINVIDENIDSRELKHIISQANLVIASRFHAVVAALSISVPCITIGWNPKYQELYRTYNIDYSEDLGSIPEIIEYALANNINQREYLKEMNIKVHQQVLTSYKELVKLLA